MENIPLLIIDDNKSHLMLETRALAEGHYDIRTAQHADEAWAVLQNFLPKLILMDIQLPGVNGLELASKLKNDPRYRDIPIIAITAYGMKGDREMVLAAGCNDYISKPIDIETFPRLIAEALKKSVSGGPLTQ